jgi:hypothetical protein
MLIGSPHRVSGAYTAIKWLVELRSTAHSILRGTHY